MPEQPRHIRIFLSSPGDVADERGLALDVLDKLPYDPLLRGKITLEIVAWDKPGADTPMLATTTPQEAINQGLPLPGQCDIVIVIFWARMGTPLPDKYKKPDGERYFSGTEWEYLNAFDEAQKTGLPLLVVYRRMEDVALNPRDDDFMAKYEQWQRVQAFFADFVNPDGSIEQGYNQYQTPEEFRQKFETHVRVLIKRLLEKPEREIPVPSVRKPGVKQIDFEPWQGSPFPGLRAFTPADEPIYFGRGRKTDALIKKVAESRFVAVVGASGSGKSSLVGAGLIPRLEDNAISSENVGSKDWHVVRFTPGGDKDSRDNPFAALFNGLAEELPALRPNPMEARRVKLNFVSDMTEAPETLLDICETAMDGAPEWSEVLLFVDQFEELFTVVDKKHLEPFVRMLSAMAEGQRTRVIVTMRSDFYHRCVDVPALSQLLEDGSFPLSVPTAGALYQMITRPAERAALEFDDNLPEQILDDVGTDPGALALMAYALDELYEIAEKRGDQCLTFADYAALDGVQGAIGIRAESVFDGLAGDSASKEQALHQVFHGLIEVDERGTATRRREVLRPDEVEDEILAMIYAFADARLLTTSSDNHVATVEVAHEAILRNWERLADWIEETADDRRLIRRIEREARIWADRGKPKHMRPNAEELNEFHAALERLQAPMPDVQDFIEPEQKRLYRELDNIDTSHKRRFDIGERLASIGDVRPGVGVKDGLLDIEWCYVDVPEHLRGKKIEFIGDEGKYGDFEVQPLYIARYLITHAQFEAFLDDPEGFDNDKWWKGLTEKYRKQEMSAATNQNTNAPRDSVSWYQCMAFTHWLNAKLPRDGWPDGAGADWTIRLPVEWEWQWAAQNGEEEREYPWGKWDKHPRANTTEAGINDRSTAVGMYPAGAAECGALDMSGNLREWCLNEYKEPANVGLSGTATRVLRGGAFDCLQDSAACASRNYLSPSYGSGRNGFRLVCAASPK